MTTPQGPASALYLFEKFEVGVVHLDAQRKVLAMNDFARRILPVSDKRPFDALVTSFHPPRSAAKVSFLLDQASACPVAAAMPMTMIINIPEQVLLIKVTRLAGESGQTTGFALVFYDVTQLVVQGEAPAAPAAAPAAAGAGEKRQLVRIPLVANHRVTFVDTAQVVFLESQAHYTRVLTTSGFQFCNLSIGDLEARLDPQRFVRVHRCFIVNLDAVLELGRVDGKVQLRMRGDPPAWVPVSRAEVAHLRSLLGVQRKT
jgi:DNA-binding LytR/AlgR family response regulator